MAGERSEHTEELLRASGEGLVAADMRGARITRTARYDVTMDIVLNHSLARTVRASTLGGPLGPVGWTRARPRPAPSRVRVRGQDFPAFAPRTEPAR